MPRITLPVQLSYGVTFSTEPNAPTNEPCADVYIRDNHIVNYEDLGHQGLSTSNRSGVAQRAHAYCDSIKPPAQPGAYVFRMSHGAKGHQKSNTHGGQLAHMGPTHHNPVGTLFS